MSQLYARVFLQILDSSIAEDFTLRHIFEDFLKLADYKTGIVDITRQALSRRLNIPEDILSEAIGKLESPDPHSRDGEFEGRRLERLDAHRDWGWSILNWQKYAGVRQKADAALRLDKHRAKVNPPPVTKEFPEHLKTPRMLEKWNIWIGVRMSKGKCKNWELLFNSQIDWLSGLTEEQAYESLFASIRNGWQGLFWPKIGLQSSADNVPDYSKGF
jgi:hypothetical protein